MRLITSIVVSGVLGLAGVAPAAFYTQMPVSDRDGYSTISINGPFTLRPDGLGSLIIGQGWDSQAHHWRGSMEFDIASISGTVSSAVLTFRREIVTNPPAAFKVNGYVGDGTVTATDMAINNQIGPVHTTNEPESVDVTSYVAALVAGHQHYLGLTLSGFPGGSGMAIRSSEPFVGSPTLNVTYTVPEPTTLGALAVACHLLQRRRPR